MINTVHGQLIDPTLQENTVGADPAVSCALLVGTNRKAPAWLIELRVQTDGHSEKAALIERIWESVQRANELAPDYARVEKGKICSRSLTNLCCAQARAVCRGMLRLRRIRRGLINLIRVGLALYHGKIKLPHSGLAMNTHKR
jgi:hypothetical protein